MSVYIYMTIFERRYGGFQRWAEQLTESFFLTPADWIAETMPTLVKVSPKLISLAVDLSRTGTTLFSRFPVQTAQVLQALSNLDLHPPIYRMIVL